MSGTAWMLITWISTSVYARDIYSWLQAEPERWEVIDASQSPIKVQDELRRVVAARLHITPKYK